MSRYKLSAKNREQTGKSGALRRQNLVPAVIYGAHIESQHVEIPLNEVEKFVRHQAPGSTLDLKVGDKTHLALFKSVQTHPVTQKVMHIDFQALKADEKVKVTIPVHFTVSEHIKGMMVQELLNEIEIVALPADLESQVIVHVEEGEIGDVMLLEQLDIAKNEKVEVLTPLDTAVYNIVEIRAFVEPEVETDEEAVEGEDATEEAAGEEAEAAEEATE